jgi:hypothetical protein
MRFDRSNRRARAGDRGAPARARSSWRTAGEWPGQTRTAATPAGAITAGALFAQVCPHARVVRPPP